MEKEFTTVRDMIVYIHEAKDKGERIKKTLNVFKQIDKVYENSKEIDKNQKLFTLIIVTKYHLISIGKHKESYELYREWLDKTYVNYLRENKVLDELFLFATEVELVCAMEIGTISNELKSMTMLIDMDSFVEPIEHNIEGFLFYLDNRPVVAYESFLIYLINNKYKKSEILNKLFPYINLLYTNIRCSSNIVYYNCIDRLQPIIKKHKFPSICNNIVDFYKVLLIFACKESLQEDIAINIGPRGDTEKLKELKDTYEKIENMNIACSEDTLHEIFKKTLKSTSKNHTGSYDKHIYTLIDNYFNICTDYTEKDITNILLKLTPSDYDENIFNYCIAGYLTYYTEDLFSLNKYDDITKLYNLISNKYHGKQEIVDKFYFELAHSFSKIGDKEKAKELYQTSVDKGIQSSAVYNNLGVIYSNEGNKEKALFYYTRAHELDPDDDTSKQNMENTKKTINDAKKKEQQLKNTYFKKLQKYHRSILFTIHKYSDEVTNDILQEIINQDKYSLRRNIDYLVSNGMLQLNNKGVYKINPLIEKLVDEYVNPKLERQIVKVDNTKIYRPIFYHESEINLYRVLIELFPQHFVFPNISLKTIFDVDKLKELLDSDIISYLFMAHVDFAIINTSTYFPVLAFEKDSDFNDREPSKSNNKYKNLIFKTGGIPLIRLRYNSGMDYEQLKLEVKDATKNLILETQSEDSNCNLNLLKEIDKRKFGITNLSVDLNLIQKEWDNIVGPGISVKSKIIDVEDRFLLVEISKDLKSIIEISSEGIMKKMLEKFSFINNIKYIWQ